MAERDDDYHPGLLSPLWRVPAAVMRTNLAAAESVADRSVRGFRAAVSPLVPGGGKQPPEEQDERSEELRAALGARMSHLLTRALHDDPAAATMELFHRLVDQLTPDEARIIGALADGQVVPLIHVYGWTRSGIMGTPTLRNASLIGKLANVNRADLTPLYVTRLRALGLVEIGPESSQLKDDYQILLADRGVMAAVKKASRTPLTARTERHSLMLSDLGLELWEACFERVEDVPDPTEPPASEQGPDKG